MLEKQSTWQNEDLNAGKYLSIKGIYENSEEKYPVTIEILNSFKVSQQIPEKKQLGCSIQERKLSDSFKRQILLRQRVKNKTIG